MALVGLLAAGLGAQEWKPLFNGKDLDGWEVEGQGVWTVLKGGTLVGQRPFSGPTPFPAWPVTAEQYRKWLYQQSWLYTKAEFDEFDLELEYWIPPGRNSGVSIRDSSRGRHTFPPEAGGPSPAHIGYEIQIIGSDQEKYPSGSVYLFAPARTGVQHPDDWNRLTIESRHDQIRVRLNGVLVAESAGDPKRPKSGPIGLQLHDQFTWVMFRNIRIKPAR